MVSDSVIDGRTRRGMYLTAVLVPKKTGAGNPAPVKRLNLYLSPIETQKSSGERPCTNSSKRSSSSFAESGSASDWSEMLPARFMTSSST